MTPLETHLCLAIALICVAATLVFECYEEKRQEEERAKKIREERRRKARKR